MFEPTETESLQTLEALAEAVERIAQRAIDDPDGCIGHRRRLPSRGSTRRAPRDT
jgi:glycine cleavage system protein P-like pyridoxal-binding family